MRRFGRILWASFSLFLAADAHAAVTFNKGVAPILYQNCAPCHHSGGLGPFPLLTYTDARKHARQIVEVTHSRYMPPWPPQPGYGDFRDSRRLTEAQVQTFADWLQSGALEGSAADLPPAPVFHSEWQLGKPDLILEMPAPFITAAAGKDIFRNFVIPTDLKQTRYVRGIELRFNQTRTVHHANIVLDHTGSLRKRDGEDGHPGFSGMDIITEAAPNEFDPDSHFLFWKPGTVLHFEPPGMNWRLDPGTDLVINLHLQPTGKPESIRAQIGLYFSPDPPKRHPMLVQLEHDGAIDIPPGDKDFVITDHLTIPVDSHLLAIYPHAHYLGKVIDAWAILPNGTRRALIRIPDWDINWQAVYDYREPVFLPKGTVVHMRISYDNSTANRRNPNSPPKRVRTGDGSEDEMGHVWLQLLPTSDGIGPDDPRLAIQEAAMRRRLEKYPADFLAHYNLASVLQLRDHLDQAIANYRLALETEPRSAGARNSLGAALFQDNDLPDAITEFKRVLEIDPGYLNAHYNLARALAASGDLDAAASEFNAFLKLSPNDSGAQAALGLVYAKQHRYADALPCFREAVRLQPTDADAQVNLGSVLAMSGDLRGAIAAYQAALKIQPDHPTARADLARAEADLRSAR
jgi:Flp pilus assembly protein TadD/mono/diheme cytochrome c family protein